MVTASANGAHRGENHRLRSKSEPAGHPTVSLIIPTLNEAENLRYVLPTLPSVVDELVIVDGGSTDGTVGVVRQLQPNATIVHEPRPGKGVALQSGFEAARGEILVMMDADGSMDPNDIATFVAALLAGADVAKGSRFLQGGGSSDLTPLRTLGNFMLTQAVRVTFGGRYSDLCYGYMAFWRQVLPAFEPGVPGFEVETFLNVRALAAGLRIVEVASYREPADPRRQSPAHVPRRIPGAADHRPGAPATHQGPRRTRCPASPLQHLGASQLRRADRG